jgi:SHS2 domain-containing protein
VSALKFRYLNHTADAKFQAFGASLEEAFANAALAMVNLMWDPGEAPASRSHTVEVSGSDLQQLLLNFLEEILFLLDSRRFLLRGVEDLRIVSNAPGFSLSGVFRGENAGRGVDIFGDVKAVTYHEMEIVESNDRWSIQVVVDM